MKIVKLSAKVIDAHLRNIINKNSGNQKLLKNAKTEWFKLLIQKIDRDFIKS